MANFRQGCPLKSIKSGLTYWFVQGKTTYHTKLGKNSAVYFSLHHHHNVWAVDDKECGDEHLKYRFDNSTRNISRFTHTFTYQLVFGTLQSRNSGKHNFNHDYPNPNPITVLDQYCSAHLLIVIPPDTQSLFFFFYQDWQAPIQIKAFLQTLSMKYGL